MDYQPFFEAEPSLETLLRLYRSGLVLFNHFLTAWELSQNVPGCGEEVVWALNHLVEDGPSRKMNTIEALRMRTQLNCLCGSHGLAALTWYSSQVFPRLMLSVLSPKRDCGGKRVHLA